VAAIQFFVDLEPQADRQPGQQTETENQRFLLDGEVEVMLQMQDGTRLVSRLKRQRGQD
jgi:hypothetical protein